MENVETKVFTAKTSAEAIELGLKELGLTREEAVITVLEEGKKRLFGSIKAKVEIGKKPTDGKRALDFVDGLFNILNINAFGEIVTDGDRIEINVTATDSHAVIGRHGEILDSIQTIAGAVANIGKDDYKKVVVDCENYRSNREKALIELAKKLAKKAVEKGRKVTLEPMNPYERRIIHSALSDNAEVKTISDGKEPNRYIVIIPNNLKPYEKKDRGEKRDFKGKKPFKGGKPHGDKREFGDKKDRGEKRGDRPSSPRPASRPARGKKEIHFGTFLGNSGNKGEE